MEGICPSLSVCTYEDTRELRPLMVGRFVDTVGQLYWSLAWNLSEPMNLQLLLVAVCLLHVQGGGSGSVMQNFDFEDATVVPTVTWTIGLRSPDRSRHPQTWILQAWASQQE